MANQSINISKNAAPGLCKPKNITDHKILMRSCVAKIKIIFNFFHVPTKNFWDKKFQAFSFSDPIVFLGSHLFDQTIYREIPIKTNNIVQTGPKIQFGGLKLGLFRLLYQTPISEVVKTDPKTPANSQIIILTKSFKKLLDFILFLFVLHQNNFLL